MRYSPKLLEYFHHASHAGALTLGEGVKVAQVGHVQNEVLELFVRIENDRVKEAGFRAHGSPGLIGGAEYVCQWLQGKPMADLQKLNADVIMEALELTKMQYHIVLLLVGVVRKIME